MHGGVEFLAAKNSNYIYHDKNVTRKHWKNALKIPFSGLFCTTVFCRVVVDHCSEYTAKRFPKRIKVGEGLETIDSRKWAFYIVLDPSFWYLVESSGLLAPEAILLMSTPSPWNGARPTHEGQYMSGRPIWRPPLRSGTREPERRLPCCRFARQNARSAWKSTICTI